MGQLAGGVTHCALFGIGDSARCFHGGWVAVASAAFRAAAGNMRLATLVPLRRTTVNGAGCGPHLAIRNNTSSPKMSRNRSSQRLPWVSLTVTAVCRGCPRAAGALFGHILHLQ